MKTWSGDRRIDLQKITREDGKNGRDNEIHKVIDEMEHYLDEQVDIESIKGRSVADVLREQVLHIEKSQISEEDFEFIMSYRWGQDYGCDGDLISAQYHKHSELFNRSEDVIQGGMGQVVNIIA